MKTSFAKFILVLVINLSALQLYSYATLSDTPRYNIVHFTDENGLPQNSIKAIAPDKNGFIWLTTEDGLLRFDGRKFVTYSNSNTGISSGRFGKIESFNTDSFLYVRNDRDEWLRIQDGGVFRDTTIPRDSDTEYSYFAKIYGADLGKSHGTPDDGRNNNPKIQLLIPMGKQRFYICSRQGVVIYQQQTLVNKIDFANNDAWDFFVIDSQLYYLNTNELVTGFSENTFKNYSVTGDVLKDPACKKNKIEVYWGYNSKNVLFYLNGSYYAVKRNADGSLQTTLIISGFDAVTNKIDVAYYDDKNQTLFLGSSIKGLYVFERKNFTALTSKLNDLGDVFYAQTVYKEKNILTPQGILFRPDAPPLLFPNLEKITRQDKYVMLTDKQGFIWFKKDYELYRSKPEHLELLQKWVMPDGIATIQEGIGEELWIGFRTKGLYHLDITKKDPQPELFIQFPNITSIYQQSQDVLWVASINGLFKVNINTKKIDTVQGMLGKYVRSIYASDKDNLWLPTYGNGFFLYAHNKVVKFPPDRDNFLSTAHCVLEDKNGFFWITTNKGLFQVAKKDLLSYASKEQEEVYYYYYGRENGFNTNEFNGGCDPCGIKLVDGRMSLPSLNGLVVFNPSGLKPVLPGKKIFVDQLLLDNAVIPFAKTVKLPRSFKRFQVAVSSPFFGNKKNISFSYALTKNGDAPLWLPIGDDGIISFSTLPAGTYNLTIRKMNGFGKNNYTQKTITFVVASPWYQTVWFFAGIILLAILLTFFATRMRSVYVVRKNRMLEQRIAERTEKLQLTLNHLEATQNDLQQKAYLQEHLIAAISHDIKTPIKYLALTLQKMYEGLKQENKSSYVGTSEVAKDYISRLYDSINNLVQYTKAQKDKNYIASEVFDLHEFVADKINLFTEPASQQRILFVNNIPAGINIISSRQVLSIILRNLLDNAVKNTSNGTITINVKDNSKQVTISITDTGYGMNEELLKWINNEKTTDRPGENEIGFSRSSGLGLIIVKELAALIRIKLIADSGQGQGAVVHLSLQKQD